MEYSQTKCDRCGRDAGLYSLQRTPKAAEKLRASVAGWGRLTLGVNEEPGAPVHRRDVLLDLCPLCVAEVVKFIGVHVEKLEL